MQYVFSMTSRMVTIALACALLLCLLLFLLGFEIGARFVAPSSTVPAPAISIVPAVAVDAPPARPAAAASDSSTY
jgi:hypothetical protein